MLFSVITITYNNLKGLRGTHESVVAQNCSDYEWIIVDGASTDGTADYTSALDAHIVSEPDDGLYDAMNKGIDRACGDYIVFMNAGDEFAAPDTLAMIKTALEKEKCPPDFIYGDALESGENEKNAPLYKSARSHNRPERGLFTHHQAMYYRRGRIKGLRYDLSCPIAADYKFTVQFLAGCENILYLNMPLCLYESGGISQTQAEKGRKEQYRIKKELRLAPSYICMLIYIRQSLTQTLRGLSPRLYWALRGRLSAVKIKR